MNRDFEISEHEKENKKKVYSTRPLLELIRCVILDRSCNKLFFDVPTGSQITTFYQFGLN